MEILCFGEQAWQLETAPAASMMGLGSPCCSVGLLRAGGRSHYLKDICVQRGSLITTSCAFIRFKTRRRPLYAREAAVAMVITPGSSCYHCPDLGTRVDQCGPSKMTHRGVTYEYRRSSFLRFGLLLGWALAVQAWRPSTLPGRLRQQPMPEVATWSASYRLQHCHSRLHTALTTSQQAAKEEETGTLMFTACGVPHSGAQEAILLRRLRVVDPSIVSLEVDETFLVRASSKAVAEQVSAFLLEAASSKRSGQQQSADAATPPRSTEESDGKPQHGSHQHVLHYGPKLNVPSVWSSNVRAILSARGVASGLSELPVLERGRAYTLHTTEAGPLSPQVERLLFDSLTECRYPPSASAQAAARARVAQAWATSPAHTVAPPDEHSIRSAAAAMGVRLSRWDADFVSRYFRQHVGRGPTEVELFDVAQSLSEHCRHWTFYGKFVVDGEERPLSLLELVKEPLRRRRREAGSKKQEEEGDNSVLAFCDNSSAIRGWKRVCVLQASDPTGPSALQAVDCHVHATLTAETHNFPCTIAPFPGAQTGVGGRIRDIQAVGRGGVTLAGLAGYAVGQLGIVHGVEHEGQRQVVSTSPGWRRPSHVCEALEVLVGASDGASDYANKFGEPLVAGFARSYPATTTAMRSAGGGGDEPSYEFVKPIMFSAGLGTVRDQHLLKHDGSHQQHPPPADLAVVKVGGPPFRVGLGGGGASSRVGGASGQGEEEEEHETNAVQRGDPEVGNKVGRLLRACVELGEANPVSSVHDQGAGGNANVLKELVAPAGGADIDMRALSRSREASGSGLTPLELWAAEYQESYGLLVPQHHLPLIKSIGERESVGVDVVGHITGSGSIRVSSSSSSAMEEEEGQQQQCYVDLPLGPLLGHREQRVFNLTTSGSKGEAARRASLVMGEARREAVGEALRAVLGQVAVGSKAFLVHKVDRSVTGLVAQQPCVGPLGLPVADVGVCGVSYWGRQGVASALGEAPNLAPLGIQAMARMALGEALTNLVWAPLTDWHDIKLQANWMWPPPADLPGQGADLYHAVEALSEAVSSLGLAIDGGKDSLSMAVSCPPAANTPPDSPAAPPVTVPSPPTVVITAYATTDDVAGVVSPDVKGPGRGEEGVLLFLDLSTGTGTATGSRRLGGSALAQALGKAVDGEGPDMRDPQELATRLKAVQRLVHAGLVLSGHDVSAGGLVSTLVEMAMAGDAGAAVDLTHVDQDAWAALFSEELGVVLEVRAGQEARVRDLVQQHAPAARLIRIGRSTASRRFRVEHGGKVLVDEQDVGELRAQWEATSLRMEREQTDPACVQAEARFIARQRRPRWHVPFSLLAGPPTSPAQHGGEAPPPPKVAILREQGSNGDREMAAAFMHAGFQAWDVTVSDLVSGRASLHGFQGLALVGGFSYGDAMGSARGWASVLQGNERARTELQRFLARPDTFSLGVCNGCQLLVELGVVGGGKTRLLENESGRFESRFVHVRVGRDSRSVLLQGMEGAVLGVWSAHGEGRFSFQGHGPSTAAAMVYVDTGREEGGAADEEEEGGEAACGYPWNPSGSEGHVAGLCSDDGRHLALMPHPERAWLRWQMPWQPEEETERLGSEDYSPWMRLFQNAYHFCIQARQQQKQ